MPAKNLSVNSVDFDVVRQNIKTYLSNSDTFTDYDFEGSAMSTLIDTLAYITYYQGIYNNFAANEMFLDTAKKRASVVSHAKALGYTPRSYSAPTALVNVILGSTAGYSSVLPVGSIFSTTVNGRNYNFVNLESAVISLTADSGGTTPHISNLSIKEGSVKSKTIVVPNNENYQKVEIDDKFVDTTTIKVTVQESATDTSGITNSWVKGNDAISLTAGSRAYFVEEDYNGNYSVNFGDGVVGVTLAAGNVVTVSYLSTSGPLANNVGIFDSDLGVNSFRFASGNTVDVVSHASGGALPQSIDSIRRLAPRSYSMQNRAVTREDFKTLIESNFSGFSSVFVYGGEDASPPQYGSVIISFKPVANTITTTDFKNNVVSFLKDRCPVTINPVVIDPEVTYARFNTRVVYDVNKTTLTPNSLSTLIQNTLAVYVLDNTDDYDTFLATSAIEKDLSDNIESIISVNTSIEMERRLTPVSDVALDYSIDFANPIFHPHDGHEIVISSEDFLYLDGSEFKTVRIRDDGFGNINLFETSNSSDNLVTNFGTVDYSSGVISLNVARLNTVGALGTIKIRAKFGGDVLTSVRDKVIVYDNTDALANAVSVQTLSQATSYTPSQVSSSSGTSTSTSSTSTSSASTSSSTTSSGGGGGGGGYGGY